jgi:hypothetical protein
MLPNVKMALTVFLLTGIAPYSSGVQQPVRTPAVLGVHPHMR